MTHKRWANTAIRQLGHRRPEAKGEAERWAACLPFPRIAAAGSPPEPSPRGIEFYHLFLARERAEKGPQDLLRPRTKENQASLSTLNPTQPNPTHALPPALGHLPAFAGGPTGAISLPLLSVRPLVAVLAGTTRSPGSRLGKPRWALALHRLTSRYLPRPSQELDSRGGLLLVLGVWGLLVQVVQINASQHRDAQH